MPKYIARKHGLNLPLVTQRYQAVVAIGASTVRGQGANGVADAVRAFLACMALWEFNTSEQKVYQRSLDRQTQRLIDAIPKNARSWGLARKCLNIFLHNAFGNRVLHYEFLNQTDGDWYEIPLDRFVAEALTKFSTSHLPIWKGVKNLSKLESELFQGAATKLSIRLGIKRVHLDAYLWADRKLSQHM